MSRTLVPVLLLVLTAAPGAAQVQGIRSAAPARMSEVRSAKPFAPKPVLPKAPAGLRALVEAPASVQGPVDPVKLAMLRALHEQAKASGQLCPLREAHQARRLAELEALLAAQQLAAKRVGGIRAAGKK